MHLHVYIVKGSKIKVNVISKMSMISIGKGIGYRVVLGRKWKVIPLFLFRYKSNIGFYGRHNFIITYPLLEKYSIPIPGYHKL